MDELEKILGRWLRWFHFRRGVYWSLHGFILGIIAGLLAAFLLTLQNRLVRPEFSGLVFGAAAAGFLLAALLAALWPVSREWAARYFDRRFGLQERVSTALELGCCAESENPLAVAMSQKQLADARLAAAAVHPRQLLPIRLRPAELGLAAALCLGALLLASWGQSHFLQTAQARRVKQAIAAEAKQVEEMRSRIEEIQSQKLTPEQVQALTRPLQEAQKKLQEAQTLEQAASALEDAENTLQALNPAEAQQKTQALRKAGQALSQEAGSPLQSFGEKLAAGDIQAAAQALQEIQTGDLSPQEQADLGQQLADAAQSLQQGDPQTAADLQTASQALQTADGQAAAGALQSAAQDLNDIASQQAVAQAAQQAAGQISQSQQQLLAQGAPASPSGSTAGQAAQSGASAANGGTSGSSGTGQGAAQAGTGGSPASGGQQAGGGAGQGESQGVDTSGSQAGNQPIAQNNGPGDGGESQYEEIYAPQRLGGDGGVDVQLPGSPNGSPGDQILGQSPSSPGTQEQSRVPYTQVLPSYQDAYQQAIEADQVPVHLRALVREYFSALQP